MKFRSACLAGLVAVAAPVAAQPASPHVQRNYQDVVTSRRQLWDLTPFELEQVREFAALLARMPAPWRETREECLKRNATSDQPSKLEAAVLDLKCSPADH